MMMSEYSDIVKQGYLKTKSKNIGHWQKKWVILRRASSKGPSRLERFTDEKSSMLNYECKVIDLTAVERVERIRADNKMYVIVLWFADSETKKFAANSDMEVTEWHEMLLKHIGLQSNMITHATQGAGLDSGQLDPRDMFHVYLLPNTSTDFCGEYLIQITSESIDLREAVNQNCTLVTWKLNTLRRYGRDDSKFTFESGRSSQTGEGLFIFTTVECERIYQKVHSATQALLTVQNMARRQKDGLLIEGAVLPVSIPLSRHHSDTESLAKHSNGDLTHNPTRDTKSLPPTPSRGPLPIPRKPGASNTPDSNANTQYLYSDAQEDRQPLISHQSFKDYSSRPLPPAPRAETNNDPDTMEYIYEEKGLSDNFRRFLKERKEDDLL